MIPEQYITDLMRQYQHEKDPVMKKELINLISEFKSMNIKKVKQMIKQMTLPTSLEVCDATDCDLCVYHNHWNLIPCKQRDEFFED